MGYKNWSISCLKTRNTSGLKKYEYIIILEYLKLPSILSFEIFLITFAYYIYT